MVTCGNCFVYFLLFVKLSFLVYVLGYRKYKTGYVWQDLLDDDLITPVSDNEYVLKGSEISSTLNKGKSSWQNTVTSLSNNE